MRYLFLAFGCFLLMGSLQNATAQTIAKPAKAHLNHLAIYVVDVHQSARFYQELFQLDTIPEPFHDNKHAWFAIN